MKNTVVLLPSYQPVESLVVLSKALASLDFPVLIVDDGSGEKFKDIFDRCKEWARVISYPKNKGKGGALKVGYKACLDDYPEQKYVITADGDGQHRIQDIIRIYERINKIDASVIGVRKFDVKVPIKSKLGNGASKFTQALSTYRYMPDNQCGLRAFCFKDLDTMIKIKGNRYEYEMNVLTYLHTHEMFFQCINIETIYEEGNTTSHFRAVQDTLRIQGSILLNGLISILIYIAQAVCACLLTSLAFKEIPYGIEAAILISFAGGLVLNYLVRVLIYRPKSPFKMMFRMLLYQILLFFALAITALVFTRLLDIHLAISYLISFFLSLVPLYYVIKGVGLVYDSQINE